VNATAVHQAPVADEHHERIVRHVDHMPHTGDLIDHGQPGELKVALDETCGFLTELLLPHMEAAEKAIYPELERLFQNRHSMTPMRREHDEIRADIKALDSIRSHIGDAPLGPGEAIRLRRSLFRLYALLKVHLAEERLYADMVEYGASPEREAALAAAMEHSGTSAF